MLVFPARSNVDAKGLRIGPALIFERFWKDLALPQILQSLLGDREFGFDVERAIFLTVLH